MQISHWGGRDGTGFDVLLTRSSQVPNGILTFIGWIIPQSRHPASDWFREMSRFLASDLFGFPHLGTPTDAPVEHRPKSLRQRVGEASWRYFLSLMGGFVGFGVLLRCCASGWLS